MTYFHRATQPLPKSIRPDPTPRPLSLTDAQLRAVTAALQPLDPAKRVNALERLAAHLRERCGTGHRPSDADVDSALRKALAGLSQQGAA